MSCQIGMLMMYSLPSVSLKYKHEIRPYIIPYALPLTQVKTGENIKKCFGHIFFQVSLTGSVYIVVMVALERYFNICKPFRFTQQVITFDFSSRLY